MKASLKNVNNIFLTTKNNNALYIELHFLITKRGCPGLVALAEDLRPIGPGFESRHPILD